MTASGVPPYPNLLSTVDRTAVKRDYSNEGAVTEKRKVTRGVL